MCRFYFVPPVDNGVATWLPYNSLHRVQVAIRHNKRLLFVCGIHLFLMTFLFHTCIHLLLLQKKIECRKVRLTGLHFKKISKWLSMLPVKCADGIHLQNYFARHKELDDHQIRFLHSGTTLTYNPHTL